jgi:hypothetical protein
LAHRNIVDPIGNEWDVWEVVPSAVERRVRGIEDLAFASDRRVKRDIRVVVPENLERGWLAFQSRTEKRRLAPCPRGWDALSDDELLDLLDRAERVGKTKRLIE